VLDVGIQFVSMKCLLFGPISAFFFSRLAESCLDGPVSYDLFYTLLGTTLVEYHFQSMNSVSNK